MSTSTPRVQTNITASLPRVLLHLEGAGLLAAAIILYAERGFSWWAFAIFLLAPDLSALGYLVNARTGSTVYNLVHTTLFPLALGLLSLGAGSAPGLQAALIWLAHIGMDRLFGYGFKYPDGFKNTHFSRI